MSKFEQVASNAPILSTPSLHQTIMRHNKQNPQNVHGEGFATIVFPKYKELFTGTIRLIMGGLIMKDTSVGNEWAKMNSVYGFSIDESIVVEDGPTVALIPFMSAVEARKMADPMPAIATYHASLIDRTNDALYDLRSPFVFQPLSES